MDVLIKIDGTHEVEALRELAGGKAAGLAHLQAIGLTVPETYALPAKLFEDFARLNAIDLEGESAAIQSAIMAAPLPPALLSSLANLGNGSWAVRSSALAEDGRDQSYAGLFESILKVQGEAQLGDAIRKCWSSAFSSRVHDYEASEHVSQKDMPGCGIGLVIQKMVAAHFAGVAFSIDAVSGDDHLIIIEAIAGLGSDLVDGKVTPMRYLVDRFTLEIQDQNSDNIVQPSQDIILKITEATIKVQAALGYPVDIEWATEGDQIYYVQLRPVTSVGSNFVEGQWTTADFRDGGISASVCTPMMWALYGQVLQHSMQSYLKEVKMLSPSEDRQWGLMAYGRPYWNVEAVKCCLLQLPGFHERRFDDDLGVGRYYEGQGRASKITLFTIIKGGLVYWNLQRRFKRALGEQESLFSSVRSRNDTTHLINFRTISDSGLRQSFKKLIEEDHRIVEAIYFESIYDASNYHTIFKHKWQKRIDEADYLDLIGGLENLSHTRLATDIEKLASAIREDPESAEIWKNFKSPRLLEKQSNQIEKHFAELLANHGYRGERELDIMEPRYHECPEKLIELIQVAIQNPAIFRKPQSDPIERYHQALERVCARLSALQARTLRKQLGVLRRLLWWKEEFRDQSTRLYAQIRSAACALGDRLVANEVLDDPKQIFFALPPETYGDLTEAGAQDALRKKIIDRRNYYLGFRNFDNPNELVNQSHSRLPADQRPPDDSHTLSGVGCSAGISKGIVRILNDPSEGHLLQPGDILVARSTDPAWTPLFRHVKGIITETGGILSHAAVISREYGIPAVLAVDKVTTLLCDGEWVQINGSLGRVTRLAETAPCESEL